MKTAIEFLVIFAIAILPEITGSIFILQDRELLVRGSSNKQKIVSRWIRHISIIILVIYIAANQPSGLSSIGLSFEPSEIPGILIVGGLTTAYLLLIFLFSKLRSKPEQDKTDKLAKSIFEAGAFHVYSGSLEKVTFLISMWLGVVAEELVYRGYIVLALGFQTGTFIPWVILSILLSVCIHLYQGAERRIMLSHVFFAIIFITVTLITKNIITAMIPHLIYDTVWLLRGWAKTRKAQTLQAEPNI
jgi:membrane protease YdiL (CAAX protease family)